MPVLRNDRWERFAQALVAGTDTRDAYIEAGYSVDDILPESVHAAIYRMRNEPEIVARITELHERAAARAEMKRSDILSMLKGDRDLAYKVGQPGAAIRAAELMGKEIGMFVDRKEIKTGQLDDADAGELDRLRETLINEAARRIAGAGRGDQEPAPDRLSLPGDGTAKTGTV